ncbi:putative quinol monooxygenase [Millisia brevis]|uniref:putative quinol monooxygenase n=1 Tax=Millisia brevis TaxID=264148 RepID=UPI0008320775|nr:putative quinol monooxygenase [Millisia brevis]
MIFIVVQFDVLDERRDEWLALTKEFTEATRAEPGNLWFDWNTSVEHPNRFVLVEAFRDQDAGVEHVRSDHFRAGLEAMRPALQRTPRILNTEIPGTEWSLMGELEIA